MLLQGYKEMSQRFGGVRRVRGDNYCALRATLFQVLSHSTQLPAWLQEEDDITVVNAHFEAIISVEPWLMPAFPRRWGGMRRTTKTLFAPAREGSWIIPRC